MDRIGFSLGDGISESGGGGAFFSDSQTTQPEDRIARRLFLSSEHGFRAFQCGMSENEFLELMAAGAPSAVGAKLLPPGTSPVSERPSHRGGFFSPESRRICA